MAWSPGQASGFTHRLRELVGVQVVVSVDGDLTFAVSGQELGIGEDRDRLFQSVVVVSGQQQRSSASIAGDVCEMDDGNDGHRVAGFVDSVDHPVGASPGAVPIGEWRSQPLPDPAGVIQQRPDDELVGGEGHRRGELVGQLPSGCG